MNPDTARKAIRRSILKQEGRKRVEVTLSKGASDDLDMVKRLAGLKDDASAVRVALFIAANALEEDPRPQPLTTNPL